MKETIRIPETIEELTERIEVIEKQINKYNEQILLVLNNESTIDNEKIDEEEMASLFEEYAYLKDLAESWKVKIDKKQDETSDVEESKNSTCFDKINPLVFLIAPLFIILAFNFFIKSFGTFFLEKLANVENIGQFFAEREKWQLVFVINLLFVIYPLVLTGLTFLVRLFVARNKETKLAYTIFQIVFGLVLIGMWLYTSFTFINLNN